MAQQSRDPKPFPHHNRTPTDDGLADGVDPQHRPPGSLKTLLRMIGIWLGDMAGRLAPGSRAYHGASLGLAVFSAVAALAFLSFLLSVPAPNWAAVSVFLVVIVLIVSVSCLAALVIRALAGVLHHLPRRIVWAAIVALGFATFHAADSSDVSSLLILGSYLIATGLVGAALGSLILTGWSRLTALQRGIALAGLTLGSAGLIGLTWLLAFPGPAIAPPVDVAELSAPPPIGLPDPSTPGKWEVTTFTYGSGMDRHRAEYGAAADLLSESVDGSPFISGWTGITELGRRFYWGFDETSLPLNGRVWMPVGESESDAGFPLVLMVHGNHTAEEFSDAGYAYLGDLLASRGFIAISVDQNFLNTNISDVGFGPKGLLKEENDARGWLLLEHLAQWRAWNEDEGHPLYRGVDLDNVALVGHSRGGEAVAIAAAFNRLPAYPDNARVTFDYGFGIRAVAAIAPVDGQYRPSGVGTPLEDISYLAVQGSHDADVRSFQGAIQYERVALGEESDAYKALLYIYGANHGQFNTTWGRYDRSGLMGRLLNTRNLISPEDQKQIARVVVSAFLESTLHGIDGYRDLFRSNGAGRAWLPVGLYISRYEAGSSRWLSTFEEDLDVHTGTRAGVTQNGYHLIRWREDMVDLKWGPLGSKGVYLGWNNDGEDAMYVIEFEAAGLDDITPSTELVFFLADADEAAAKAAAEADLVREPIDLTLEVIDHEGDVARLPLSHGTPLLPLLPARVTKVPWTNETPIVEVVFQSYAFPLADFQAAAPTFDPARLSEIRFVFDRTPAGEVVLDDVGLR